MGKEKEMDGDIFPPSFRQLLVEIVRLFVFVLNLLIFSPHHICVHLLLHTAPQLRSFISVFIFLGSAPCTHTGEVSTFLLPFSDALMGNVLMHGYVSLEASHFRPWLCQVNTLIKDKKYVV